MPVSRNEQLVKLTRIGYLAGLSVIFGVMRIRSGSLVFPILGHMALNGGIAIAYLLRR